MKQKKTSLKPTQVMTPPWATKEMIALIGTKKFGEEDTYLFEPSCGDGGMLKTCCEEIHKVLLEKYKGNKEQALADLCFKFYAIDLCSEMVVKARTKMYDFLKVLLKECDKDVFSSYILARIIHEKIEHKDFFEFMKGKQNCGNK